MIFETHAHYDDPAFDGDRKELLSQMENNGIYRVVNVSSDLESCSKTIELTKQYSFIYGAVGIHPSDSGDLTEEDICSIEEQSRHEKIVAIGEIGLDYYWDSPAREVQKKWFVRQLALAAKRQLPVIIHSRDAAQDTYDIMKEQQAEKIGGVIHCFSYGPEMAERYLKMGFYIGIGGVLTFKNARKLKEVAAMLPLDSIVLETDSPYLAPEPNRGKRNSSLNLSYIVEELAGIKRTSAAEVMCITTENAKRLYGMK
ncbi:MAG TPA: TatD family hydrolase [Lachnospiraceae bacterium]|nr:TatD family hydrolase [Lachnospiraceae bacterium]